MNMHAAIVKLRGEDTPVVIGIPNTGYARTLATMPRAEWVQVITPSGYVVSGDGEPGMTYPPIQGPAFGERYLAETDERSAEDLAEELGVDLSPGAAFREGDGR